MREGHQTMSLSVGDGFKFGCGLILSFVAFYFILVILLTGILLVGMLFNVPLPSLFGQPLKFIIAY